MAETLVRKVAISLTDSLNVRTEPNTDCSVITTVSRDEELEFGNTPCCKEYAYSIGINQDTSPYVNGTAVEIYKPNSISREQFEDILHSDDLGISQIIYDEANEIYYINVGDEDAELPY